MACPVIYPGLPCHLSGLGYTARPTPLGLASIELQEGQGAQFPVLLPGQWFYATVSDGCRCCETVRVTARDGDVLTVVREAPGCECIGSNAAVRYVVNTRDAILAIASEAPINVVPPLLWDCETRTLSLDCAALREMVRECDADAGGD